MCVCERERERAIHTDTVRRSLRQRHDKSRERALAPGQEEEEERADLESQGHERTRYGLCVRDSRNLQRREKRVKGKRKLLRKARSRVYIAWMWAFAVYEKPCRHSLSVRT